VFENRSTWDGSIMAQAAKFSTTPPSNEVTWRRQLEDVVIVAAAAVALASLIGFAGRLWWGFDLFNHFRICYFWGLSLGTLLLAALGRRRIALALAALLVLDGFCLLPFYRAVPSSAEGGTPLRVMTLNVWAQNTEHARVIDCVRHASPDIFVLEEVDQSWTSSLEEFKADWPHFRLMPNGGHFGIAIFSRLPIDDLRIESFSDQIAFALARFKVDATPVTLVGVHLLRPMSDEGAMYQARELAELTDLLNREKSLKVVLGDFNTSSWSYLFAEFAQRANLQDTRRGQGVQPSWPAFVPPPLRIPIDHCLTSPDIRIRRREIGSQVGSDHLPVIVDLEIPQANADRERVTPVP
jgi:endonuclease/exonuclease/phosphatase (EEP) superfamily protein YafD